MTDIETLAERLRTVERAVTDGTTAFPEVTELAERRSAGHRRGASRRHRRADGGTRSSHATLRWNVRNIRSVNEDVEQRADAALATTDDWRSDSTRNWHRRRYLTRRQGPTSDGRGAHRPLRVRQPTTRQRRAPHLYGRRPALHPHFRRRRGKVSDLDAGVIGRIRALP